MFRSEVLNFEGTQNSSYCGSLNSCSSQGLFIQTWDKGIHNVYFSGELWKGSLVSIFLESILVKDWV